MPDRTLSQAQYRDERGFTLTDLTVAICIVGLLALCHLSALGVPLEKGKATTCMDNLRQLGKAMTMYSEDFGYFPPNEDNAMTYGGWVRGIMNFDGSNTDNTNTQFLVNPQFGQLGDYTRDAGLYRCPQDQSYVTPSRGDEAIPRVRSYSLNGAVGTKRDGDSPVDGPWLDGNHSHTANETWYTYARLDDIVDPRPADLYWFLDEHPDSINDGAFSASMLADRDAKIIDYPGNYHDRGCNFVFADGHVENRRWRDGRTMPPVQYTGALRLNEASPGNQDVTWISEHTSARIEE
jgi:prepilin-type processing-associated H-X9-DG protein